MTTEKKPVPPRIVDGSYYRDDTLMGPIEIIGSTKHGTTTLLAVEDDIFEKGDRIKAKSFVLAVREFVVIGRHEKPMKIAGTWYEVRPIAPPPKPSKPVPAAKGSKPTARKK
jgi:hypothetical protein